MEKQLAKEKARLDRMQAPGDLESRLRHALDKQPPKRKRKWMWKPLVAAAVLCLFLATVQYNALAYYSKKLLGFDELMSSALQELNEQGMGQEVNAVIHFEDGTELIIDGIITDSNQLLLYYTLSHPEKVAEELAHTIQFHQISGFLTKSSMRSGVAMHGEDETIIKGERSFEPVSPFAKQLELEVWNTSDLEAIEEKTITFPYNPNLAMQTQLEQRINETFTVDQGEVTIQKIKATPTQTVVTGKISVRNLDRADFAFDGIELIVDGKALQSRGGGYQTSFTGATFDIRYDALPSDLEELKLHMQQFVGYEELESEVSLVANENETTSIGERTLDILDVSVREGQTEIRIATEEDVTLDGVSVETSDGRSISLQTITRQDHVVGADEKWMKERTLLFETEDQVDKMIIKGMHFLREYDQVIEIDVR